MNANARSVIARQISEYRALAREGRRTYWNDRIHTLRMLAIELPKE